MSYSKPILCITALSTLALFATALVPALQEHQMPTPTEEHKHLLSDVGEYEGTLSNYYDDTGKIGTKPTTMPAKESVSGIGGFWLLSQFTCEMGPGMQYQGSGHIGYDAMKKKFVGTWVDSMTSHLSVMEGELDAKSKALVMRWEAPDMATGKMQKHRSESVENGESRTMTFYEGEGAGQKSMVIEMKRTKGKATEAGATK